MWLHDGLGNKLRTHRIGCSVDDLSNSSRVEENSLQSCVSDAGSDRVKNCIGMSKSFLRRGTISLQQFQVTKLRIDLPGNKRGRVLKQLLERGLKLLLSLRSVADARLAGNEDDLTRSRDCLPQKFVKLPHLRLAAHK